MFFETRWHAFVMWFLQTAFTYHIYIVAVFLQAVFILLPVDLKNWDEDIFNVWTYIALQSFIAGFLFLVTPLYVDVFPLSSATQVIVMCGVCLLSLLRASTAIPLELSRLLNLKIPSVPAWAKLPFNTFQTREYLENRTGLPMRSIADDIRYQVFRERLLRLRKKKDSSKE